LRDRLFPERTSLRDRLFPERPDPGDRLARRGIGTLLREPQLIYGGVAVK
jgi:hypothetical protein